MTTIYIIESVMSRYGFTLSKPDMYSSDWKTSDMPFAQLDKPDSQAHNAPRMSFESELHSLPGDSLFRDIVSDEVHLPDQIQKQLPCVPDNVREARQHCAIQFIDSILLPRMEDPNPLSVVELTQAAVQFKMDFKLQHPADVVGNFELIPSTEMLLIELRERSTIRKQFDPQWEHTHQLIDRAGREIRQMLDSEVNEELFTI